MEKKDQKLNKEESSEATLETIESTEESLRGKELRKSLIWKWGMVVFLFLLIITTITFLFSFDEEKEDETKNRNETTMSFSDGKKVEEPEGGDEATVPISDEPQLQAKEICENSGGRWDSIVCNMPGCKSEYFCNCEIRAEDAIENELSKREAWFLLPVEGLCRECEGDADCGENSCQVTGGECRQETAVCEEGVCHTQSYLSFLNDTIKYTCQNNRCEIEGEQVLYISSINFDNTVKEGDDIAVVAMIQNMSERDIYTDIQFSLKDLYNDTSANDLNIKQALSANEKNKVVAYIPTDNLSLDSDTGFNVSVMIDDVGSVAKYIMIEQSEDSEPTTDWVTYKNEEYGFDFSLPSEYREIYRSGAVQLTDPLYMKIYKYDDAPEVLTEDMHALIMTKSDLDKLRLEIEESPLSFNNGNKYRYTKANYYPLGANFYNQVSFFVGKDYIRLEIYFDRGSFTWGEDSELIEGTREDLLNGEVDNDTLKMMENFEKIISTFNFS